MKISIREKDIGMFKAIDVSCKDGVIVLDFDCANCGVPMVNSRPIVPVPMVYPLKDLNHLTWSEIEAIGAAGKARETFALGATKKDHMKNGYDAEWKIIGFDHDDLADGSGKAPISWDMVRAYKDEWSMNDEATNAGGWDQCKARKRVDGELLSLCSDELQAIIKPVIKLTSAGSCSKDIIKSICKLWLKSEKELFGRCIYSAPGEGHWYEYYRQEDVPYFALDENGDRVCQWLRSALCTGSNLFCSVNTDGSANNNNANYSLALLPGFCDARSNGVANRRKTTFAKGDVLPWVKVLKTALRRSHTDAACMAKNCATFVSCVGSK